MRFLADESCDFAAVRALRADGHDVLAVSESGERSVDAEVMERALLEDRILLTEDKDFGWLTYVARIDSPGVILIRFPASARGLLAGAIRRVVREHGTDIRRSFTVLSPGAVRISPGRLRDA
jgi:predicted nuclease of predicted toxin-antitoxin system